MNDRINKYGGVTHVGCRVGDIAKYDSTDTEIARRVSLAKMRITNAMMMQKTVDQVRDILNQENEAINRIQELPQSKSEDTWKEDNRLGESRVSPSMVVSSKLEKIISDVGELAKKADEIYQFHPSTNSFDRIKGGNNRNDEGFKRNVDRPESSSVYSKKSVIVVYAQDLQRYQAILGDAPAYSTQGEKNGYTHEDSIMETDIFRYTSKADSAIITSGKGEYTLLFDVTQEGADDKNLTAMDVSNYMTNLLGKTIVILTTKEGLKIVASTFKINTNGTIHQKNLYEVLKDVESPDEEESIMVQSTSGVFYMVREPGLKGIRVVPEDELSELYDAETNVNVLVDNEVEDDGNYPGIDMSLPVMERVRKHIDIIVPLVSKNDSEEPMSKSLNETLNEAVQMIRKLSTKEANAFEGTKWTKPEGNVDSLLEDVEKDTGLVSGSDLVLLYDNNTDVHHVVKNEYNIDIPQKLTFKETTRFIMHYEGRCLVVNFNIDRVQYEVLLTSNDGVLDWK